MQDKLRSDAFEIFRKALSAVEPSSCISNSVCRDDNTLIVGDRAYDLTSYENVFLVSFGKAAVAMASAMETILDEYISDGFAITKYGFGGTLKKLEVLEAGHPIPDDNSVAAGIMIRDMLERTGKNDLIVFLISGGGSALLTLPRKGISVSDIVGLTDGLICSGATIDELNTVRKHLSAVKGGGLAKMAYPSESVSLILSDVVGDPLDVIASGPTVPDSSTFEEFLEIITRYDLKLSSAVQGLLDDGLEGVLEETPKSSGPIFDRTYHYLVGTNSLALHEAERKASELGYNTLILTSSLIGEAKEVAKVFASIAREERLKGMPVPLPACILAGGETTVTMRGKGKGGRCQEMALSFGIEVNGLENVLLLPGATDGNDGTSDAAGAFADGSTFRDGKDIGMDARLMLLKNNSYSFFKETGDLLLTGPTGTNVMDIYILLIT
ncbi:glycerate kinase [Methanolobus sp. ZRKC3]|uniref:glycerate kinase type-2 family protein n=1 Tax=Methanolobus sp. ZRKC3 TaxID=3125786 RepID=UPI00324A3733